MAREGSRHLVSSCGWETAPFRITRRSVLDVDILTSKHYYVRVTDGSSGKYFALLRMWMITECKLMTVRDSSKSSKELIKPEAQN